MGNRGALPAIVLGLSGCAAPMVNLAYKPDGPPQPAILERRPALYLAPAADSTDGQVETYQSPFTPSRPAAQTLQESLALELRRLQYPLVESLGQAAGSVEAVLVRQAVDLTGAQGLSDLVTAEYAFDITLKDARQRAVLAKRISGAVKGVRPGFGVPSALYSGMLSAAIGQAMRKVGPLLESEDLPALLEGRRPARKALAAEPPAPIRIQGQGKSKKGAMVTRIEQADGQEAAPEPAAPAPAAPPRSDVDDVPARRAARKGHAVIIGIERYRESLPPALFAAADARIMARYAGAVLGYPEENVALMTDDRASKGDFEKNLERWLANRVEKDDEVFVYFSGHGAPDPKTGDAFLVPYDADPTYIRETGYPLKRLYAELAKLPTQKITVALDSCFSGAGGRSVIARGARPLVSVKAAEAPAKIAVLSASAGDEISNSYEDRGHGLFTYFLLKGLKASGPDFKAAFDYLKPEVARVARRQYNADQNPQWISARD